MFWRTWTRKNEPVWTSLQTSCYEFVLRAVYKMCSHCLLQVVVTSLGRPVENALQTCYQIALASLIQLWCNNVATNLATQDCNNIVRSCLYQICCIVTKWIVQQVCLNFVASCAMLLDSLGQAVRTRLFDNFFATCYKMWYFYARTWFRKYHWNQTPFWVLRRCFRYCIFATRVCISQMDSNL